MVWQPNRLEQERLEKVQTLESLGIEPFPRRAERTHTTAEAIALAEAHADRLDDPDQTHDLKVTVCGRIRRLNIKGNVSFLHIEDQSGRVQLFLRINDMSEQEYNLVREKFVEMDDFVQAAGTMMRTKAGEISVRVTQFKLLAKALSPLPVIKQQKLDDGTIIEHGEFSDTESRYRQRYADLAVNHDVREVFVRRAEVIRSLRRFLDDQGMLEVETPILQPIYGGAAARPFTTHHNDLNEDLFLRISFELYLKRLLVGGYDAVYEIGRDFRNEGVSFKHNTEFTMLEFYKAYIDYRGVMDITERMLAYTAERVTGSTTVEWQGHVINFAPPWQRLTMRQAIQQYAGIDYMDYRDAESLERAIRAAATPEINEKLKPGQPWGKLVEFALGEFAEKSLIQPTFILDYPRDISPFAKRVDYDDLHVERFEAYIAGMEMANAFTELNDPRDQESRFLEMAALFRDEEDDATPLDEDYLRAMRYGMPPNGGFGMGIDRLTMLLTNQRSIRDVLLYPHMRRIEQAQEAKTDETP
ncbi:lysine--tRNA ligase [Anaerolineae bacterium CFX9]|jgi:lysyl-tRNA synthetase class 2|nr:lysine--tRNA ligase [Anaerolineae bacterium CFX9]